jgi:dTDP-4-dehydrorhamnose reductase
MSLGKIIVTGASGLLGANLVYEFARIGEHVVALCRNHLMHLPGVDTVECDITDSPRIAQLLECVHPQWIVHCAAATNVDWCERNPSECHRLNAKATRHLAALARQLDARIVYLSTDAVFDGHQGNYQERASPNPVNVYGQSKLEGEVVSRLESESVLVLRTNLFGWNAQDKLGLAEWLLARLAGGYQVPGFDDVSFSPLLVNEIARLLLKMMAGRLEGVYHAGSCETVTKYEFACALARKFGYSESRIQRASVRDAGMTAPRPLNTSLDSRKLQNALGSEMPDVEAGISQLRALWEGGYPSMLKNFCMVKVN